MKIVINTRVGGFGLSDEAKELYIKLAGLSCTKESLREGSIERNCLFLVQVVKELGLAANDWCSQLKIVEIPDGVDYYISDDYGVEIIQEKHRSWG